VPGANSIGGLSPGAEAGKAADCGAGTDAARTAYFLPLVLVSMSPVRAPGERCFISERKLWPFFAI